MTTVQKIALILRLSGLTQEVLAQRLGVSFPALNAWARGRAKPRQGAMRRIDKLLTEFAVGIGVKSPLAAMKHALARRAKSEPLMLKRILNQPDLRDEFVLALTYHSDSIEGSTLTKGETAAVLFDNVALKNRPLREQVEAKNHQAALEYLWSQLSPRDTIKESLVIKLHAILMNGITADAGTYRRQAVRIVGANVPTANHASIQRLMDALVVDLNRPTSDPVGRAAHIHARFEQIHPFSDGNGRVGRLLLNAMLLKDNFAPAVIEMRSKREYLKYLNLAQLHEDHLPLEQFIAEAVLIGYAIVGRQRGG